MYFDSVVERDMGSFGVWFEVLGFWNLGPCGCYSCFSSLDV